MLDDDSLPFRTLLTMQGWPQEYLAETWYTKTELGTHTFTIPLAQIRGNWIAAVLSLGVLNQTPVYGVMGFQVKQMSFGYNHFPQDSRFRLQMCPSYQEVLLIWETEIVPHLAFLSQQGKD